MKYYYIVNGEINEIYNNKRIAYNKFQNMKLKLKKKKQKFWHLSSENMYQILFEGNIHTYCSSRYRVEFFNEYGETKESQIQNFIIRTHIHCDFD